MIKGDNFVVATLCMTYNHSSFIVDTLEGFTRQLVDFPVVFVIVDDASTDGCSNILREWAMTNLNFGGEDYVRGEKMSYGQLFFGNHKNNICSYYAILLLSENHFQTGKDKEKLSYIAEWTSYSSFIAICEGDDYWIEPTKLKKQVKALEDNCNAQLCYTGYKTIDENDVICKREVYDFFRNKSHSGDNLYSLFEHNYIMTPTVCVRRECFYSNLYCNSPHRLDYSLFLSCALLGDFVYLGEPTSCYRNNSASLTNTRNERVAEGLREVFYYFANLYLDNKQYKRPWFEDLRIKALIYIRMARRRRFKNANFVFSWRILDDILILCLILYTIFVKKSIFRIKLLMAKK